MPLGWEGKAEMLLFSVIAMSDCFSTPRSEKILIRHFCDCGVLTLAGCQVCTKATLSLPS